ncbi:MAG: methyltransferase domain-containing protein [Planctomycetes bacterium]|nr:methyltransferase domain-containing protein [Planctomycetota bacterium]
MSSPSPASPPLKLVCPGCRHVDASGELHVSVLEVDSAHVLRCLACERRYPVVDEVPIVLADLESWLETERIAVLARDLPADLSALLTRGSSVLNRDAHLRRVFEYAGGELPDRIQGLVGELSGEILDLGCGPGMHPRTDTVGLELNFALARAFPGRGVVGDAADPPFLAHSFDAVLAINLLDSCPDPRTVLGQADALLRPGGTLILACPYAWDPELTPLERQFEATDLLAALSGDPASLGLRFNYELDLVEDRVSWRLQQGSRTVQEHACQLIVARKLGEA